MHLAARRYRRALYTQRVREVFPCWNGSGVSWVDEHVEPSGGVKLQTDAVAIALDLLRRVGGPYNRRHADTAFLYGCELVAHARGQSYVDAQMGAAALAQVKLFLDDSDAQAEAEAVAQADPPLLE